LPIELTDPALAAFARSLEVAELARALSAATGLFLAELKKNDSDAFDRLEKLLLERAAYT
jgi:hypothetical protein